MRELLERWSRLEPERCRVDDERAGVMTGVGTPLERPRFTAQFHRLGQYEPDILAAVIEAIEARGWGWDISSSVWRPASPDGPEARRTYNAFVNLRPGVNLDTLREEYNQPSPAAALLCVYLAALEAEAGQ